MSSSLSFPCSFLLTKSHISLCSPEEYKALSSKQKRQLRNKISARNFRNRRKDYISQLEGHLGERDEIIAAVRNELGSTQWENEALR